MAEMDEELRTALDAMWRDMLPGVRGRMDSVASAVDALAAGRDDRVARETGRAEAHKLAGLLGTLGKPRATELARRLEHALAAGPPPAADLPRVVAELRDEVER